MERKKRRAGFTLMELMIVIVIIGILGTVVVVNVLSKPDEARVAKAKSDMQQLHGAIIQYKVDTGDYPETLEDLVNPPSDSGNVPKDGYLLGQKKVPRDPWGNEFVLEFDGSQPYLICYGKDGQSGGEEFDADIYYPPDFDPNQQ